MRSLCSCGLLGPLWFASFVIGLLHTFMKAFWLHEGMFRGSRGSTSLPSMVSSIKSWILCIYALHRHNTEQYGRVEIPGHIKAGQLMCSSDACEVEMISGMVLNMSYEHLGEQRTEPEAEHFGAYL